MIPEAAASQVITPRLSLPLGSLLLIFLVFLSGIHGSLGASFLSMILMLVFLVSALPLGHVLAGTRGNMLIYGAVAGMILHTLALAILARILGVHRWVFISYILCAVTFGIILHRKKVILLRSEQDHTGLFVFLLSVMACIAPAIYHVGIPTAEGFAYRAYFNADFFRNLAVTASVSNYGIPPDNPYVSGYTLHYYWFLHLLVAFWKTILPNYRSDYMLVQFTLVAVCIFCACLYLAARSVVRHPRSLMFLLPLLVFAGSYKALLIAPELFDNKFATFVFRDLNIEGLLRWKWQVPQVDFLYRALLYAPQHLLALSVLLLLIMDFPDRGNADEEKQSTPSGRLLLFCLICGTLGFSAFVGGFLILAAGIWQLSRAARKETRSIKEIGACAVIGAGFLLLYLLCFQMFDLEAGPAILFIPKQIAFVQLPGFLVLNFGFLLLAGVPGIVFGIQSARGKFLGVLLLIAMSVLILFRVNLPGASDISLKFGYVCDVLLVLFSLILLDRTSDKKWVLALSLAAFLPAVATWIMDAHNSQDTGNGKFTTVISKEDERIYEWIQQNLPGRSVFQYPREEGGFLREYVTEIAAIGGRSVYIGDKNFNRIFETPKEEVLARERILRELMLSPPKDFYARSKAAGIEYWFFSSNCSRENKTFRAALHYPKFSVMVQDGEAQLIRVNKKTNE